MISNWRTQFEWSLFCWWLCTISLTPLFGIDRDVQIDQLHHTAWTGDNAGIGETKQIVQTSDGFLWLLTSDDRLLRFDGVHFEAIETAMAGVLPTGEHRWDDVFAIAAVPDGGLWIGHHTPRVDLLKDGQVHTFSTENCSNASIRKMVPDHDGVLWIVTAQGLGRLQGSQCDSIGPAWGYLGGVPIAMLVDRGGTLWVKSPDGRLFFLRPGAKVFKINASGSWDSKEEGLQILAQAPDGSIWQASVAGVQRILQGSDDRPGIRAPMLGLHADVTGILFDRDGALWLSMGDGLHRIPYPDQLAPWQPKAGEKFPELLTRSAKSDGSVQTFTAAQGLSSNRIWKVFQDREGNIWTATGAGIDLFRDNAFIRVPLRSTYSGQLTFAAGERGTVWAAGWDPPLFNLGNRVLSTHIKDENISALYRDPAGVIWVGTFGKSIWHSSGSAFVRVGWPPGEGKTYVRAMSMDHAGGLWVSLATGDIFRLAGGVWTPQNDRLGIPVNRAVYAIATDDQGRVWFNSGRVNVLNGDDVKTFDTPKSGYVTLIEVKGPHTWLGGLFGFGLLMNNHFQVIQGAGGDVFRATTGIIELSDGDLWINTKSGVVRIPAAEVQKAIREPAYQVQFERFDTLDGLDGKASYWIPVPTAIAGLDGKLWFSTNKGVFWTEPERIVRHKNLEPPPVHVEQVTADHTSYDVSSAVTSAAKGHLGLPPRVRDLEIDYTALSFVAPEKVLFRYKLEGWDQDWQSVGNRRRAFFTNLPPGNYRFRVAACNNSGVWNEDGTFLDFSIAPAYYQTTWFRALCGAVFLALLWAAYQLRVRQLQRRFNIGLEARVNERTRIARELHDTLLQSLHGVMFQFQAARNMLPHSPENAMQTLDEAISGTRDTIAESRDAIHDLRSQPVVEEDLAQSLEAVGEELAGAESGAHTSPTFRVIVEGAPQKISTKLQGEVYRIARELMRNAFRHAGANQIEVEIRYDKNQLRLRVRDDGKGIDPKVLETSNRPGHWGLPGVNERAERIGARLRVWSEAGAGTEVELTVSSAIAYGGPDNNSRFGLFRKDKKS